MARACRCRSRTQRQAHRVLERRARRASPRLAARSRDRRQVTRQCRTQHPAQCDLGGDVGARGLRDSLRGAAAAASRSPSSHGDASQPETGAGVARVRRRHQCVVPSRGTQVASRRVASPRLARTAYPSGRLLVGRRHGQFRRELPGQLRRRPPRSTPVRQRGVLLPRAARRATTRHASRSLGPRATPAPARPSIERHRPRSPSFAMLRLSSGDRGVDASKGLALVGARRAPRWPARPPPGRWRRPPEWGGAATGRSSGAAPSSALNSALGAVAGLPPSSATTWRRTPTSCSAISAAE